MAGIGDILGGVVERFEGGYGKGNEESGKGANTFGAQFGSIPQWLGGGVEAVESLPGKVSLPGVLGGVVPGIVGSQAIEKAKGLFSKGEEPAPTAVIPDTGASTKNPDVNSRFSALATATKLQPEQRDQVRALYDMLIGTGSTDEEAYAKAVEQARGLFGSNSNTTQKANDLGRITSLQSQAAQYVQPYAEQLTNLGNMAQSAYQGIASRLPSEFQGVNQFLADISPVEAQTQAAALTSQASLAPFQAENQYQAQQAEQYQGMLNQYGQQALSQILAGQSGGAV